MLLPRVAVLLLLMLKQNCLSFRLFKLGPVIRKDNSGYRTKGLYFKDSHGVRRDSKHGSNFLGKSVLVSRIGPHGYHTGTYEYDSSLNTIYKPLIRFHVKKPNAKYAVEAITDKPKVLGYVIKMTKQESLETEDILTDTEHNILRHGHNGHDEHNEHHGHISDTDSLMKYIDKSLENPLYETDSGQKTFSDSEEKKHTPKTSKIIPQYPYWNYWTYAKTIHQDECPGSLVRLGQVCIAPSGHRRITGLV